MCFLFVFVFVSGKKFVQIYLHCVCISVYVRRPIIKRSGFVLLSDLRWKQLVWFVNCTWYVHLPFLFIIRFLKFFNSVMHLKNTDAISPTLLLHCLMIMTDNSVWSQPRTGESSLSLSESFISSSIFIFFLVTMFKYSIPSAFHSRIKVDHGNDWNMTKHNLFFCCYV